MLRIEKRYFKFYIYFCSVTYFSDCSIKTTFPVFLQMFSSIKTSCSFCKYSNKLFQNAKLISKRLCPLLYHDQDWFVKLFCIFDLIPRKNICYLTDLFCSGRCMTTIFAVCRPGYSKSSQVSPPCKYRVHTSDTSSDFHRAQVAD